MSIVAHSSLYIYIYKDSHCGAGRWWQVIPSISPYPFHPFSVHTSIPPIFAYDFSQKYFGIFGSAKSAKLCFGTNPLLLQCD